jgi:hypothetical protein
VTEDYGLTVAPWHLLPSQCRPMTVAW